MIYDLENLMTVGRRQSLIPKVLHDCEILKKGFLHSVAADVLESLVDDLLDVVRLDVEVFGHDDEVKHVLQRDLLFSETFFQLLQFALQFLKLVGCGFLFQCKQWFLQNNIKSLWKTTLINDHRIKFSRM